MFAFSLLLDISRKICAAIERTKKGNFFYKYWDSSSKKAPWHCRTRHDWPGYGEDSIEILRYTRHYDEAFCKRFDIKKVSFDKLLSQSCDLCPFHPKPATSSTKTV